VLIFLNITTAFGIEFICFRVHLLALGFDSVYKFCVVIAVGVSIAKAIHSPKLLGFSLSGVF